MIPHDCQYIISESQIQPIQDGFYVSVVVFKKDDSIHNYENVIIGYKWEELPVEVRVNAKAILKEI